MDALHKTKAVGTPRLERIALIKAVLQGYRARLDEELLPLEVSAAQLRALWTVEQNPAASGAEVSRLCSVTPQTGQATLARMEANGWLVRKASEKSERVLVAALTAKGRRILRKAKKVAEDLDREIWAGVTKRELDGLDAGLKQVLGRLGR